MNQRRRLTIVAAALLPLAFVAASDDERQPAAPSRADGAPAASVAVVSVPSPSASMVVERPPATTAGDAADSAGVAPADRGPAAGERTGGEDPVVRVSSPPFVDRGSLQELVVGVRLPAHARHVAFTLSADFALVALLDASRGKGSPRGEASFEASVDEAANRIAIAIDREDGWSGDEIADLAVVRFEGVAAGGATIGVSDIVVRDAAGAAIPVPPFATAELVVMSGPI